jgi:hypothetical protein
MLTRTAFAIALVIASVSGSLAAQQGQASGYTQTIYNPAGARIADPFSDPQTCWRLHWGFPCK